jgi:AraC-like DNA-binding protein
VTAKTDPDGDFFSILLDGKILADTLESRYRVSSRYIRNLFEGENTSLSRFVFGQRLVKAHRMLTDPRHTHLTVSAVAFQAGFRDLSTFQPAIPSPLWRHAV